MCTLWTFNLSVLTMTALFFIFFFRQADDKNKCEMTYMWRQLHFMSLNSNSSSRYSLFLYGEGQYARNFLKNKVLDGFPIIFVPGSAGSGKQVRSIGSILQNKTDLRQSSFHFDTFALDFNNELSGLSSEYFKTQSNFLGESISFVWNLYEKKPPGIVLIGHSMGGIVIQSLLLNKKNLNLDKISMIISFAAPYRESPFLFDSGFLDMWRKLKFKKNLQFADRLVSVSGGLKDEFIDEEWTQGDDFFYASTVSIDGVWLETDHKCIVWCNQLLRHTTRLLIDYVQNIEHFFSGSRQFLESYYSVDDSFKKILFSDVKNPFSTSSFKCLSSDLRRLFNNQTSDDNFLVSIMNRNSMESQCLLELKQSIQFSAVNKIYTVAPISFSKSPTYFCARQNNFLIWVLPVEDIYLPVKDLSLFSVLNRLNEVKFHVENGLKVLPLQFSIGRKFVIYKMIFLRQMCNTGLNDLNNSHRVIYLFNNLSRYNEFDTKMGVEFVFLYKWDNAKAGDAKVYFFDELNCEYTLKFQVQFYHTIVKAVRRYRHYISFSFIITTLLWHLFNERKFAGSYLNNYTLLFFGSLLSLLLTILFRHSIDSLIVLVTLNIINRCLFSVIIHFVNFVFWRFNHNERFVFFNVVKKILLLLIVGLFSLFTHSLFIGFFCGITNLLVFCSKKILSSLEHTLCTLQLLIFLFQFPSAYIYFWNVKVYGYFRSNYDPFFKSNLLISFLTLFSLFSKLCSRYHTNSKLASSVKVFIHYVSSAFLHFGCIYIVFFEDPLHFFQVLDNLCLLCVFILGILWKPFMKKLF